MRDLTQDYFLKKSVNPASSHISTLASPRGVRIKKYFRFYLSHCHWDYFSGMVWNTLIKNGGLNNSFLLKCTKGLKGVSTTTWKRPTPKFEFSYEVDLLLSIKRIKDVKGFISFSIAFSDLKSKV